MRHAAQHPERAWRACFLVQLQEGSRNSLEMLVMTARQSYFMQSTDLDDVDQSRSSRKSSISEKGRLQGRHAVHGLADARRAPRQEGPSERRRMTCLPHVLLGIR